MKIETIKKYIKQTNIPYYEIYERAQRGGLIVEYEDSAEKGMQIVTARDNRNFWCRSCFPKAKNNRDICCANWNEYNF